MGGGGGGGGGERFAKAAIVHAREDGLDKAKAARVLRDDVDTLDARRSDRAVEEGAIKATLIELEREHVANDSNGETRPTEGSVGLEALVKEVYAPTRRRRRRAERAHALVALEQQSQHEAEAAQEEARLAQHAQASTRRLLVAERLPGASTIADAALRGVASGERRAADGDKSSADAVATRSPPWHRGGDPRQERRDARKHCEKVRALVRKKLKKRGEGEELGLDERAAGILKSPERTRRRLAAGSNLGQPSKSRRPRRAPCARRRSAWTC